MSTSPRTCAHTCQPLHPPQKGLQPGLCPPAARLPSCAQNFLPNLTQSLAISRVSLVHLFVPLTFQSIGQRGDFYRLPAGRIRLRFARFSCTKTAICAAAGAGAVNHPHHTNHVNHSSNKCQPSLIHALPPVNPSIRRTRPTPAPRDHARGLRQPPVCRHAPKISHTISHNLSQSLVISPASLLPVNPFNRCQNASNVNPV